MTTDSLPLQRFTIVEVNDADVPLCLRLATSLAAKIAADLGADVLKIEPPGGDPVRRAPPLLPSGASALFQFLNTSKRSLVLDLGTEAGRANLVQLLDRSHACLFEEPASIAPLIAPARRRRLRSRPSQRKWMPQRDRSASSRSRRGRPDAHDRRARTQTLKLGGHQHPSRRLTAFTGSRPRWPRARPDNARRMSACRCRGDAMGELEGGIGCGRHGTSPGREGKASEFQVVPCRDGHVAVVYTITQWPATRTLIGGARLQDEKFATRAGRRKHIASSTRSLRVVCRQTRAEIQKTAQAKGVPFGPIFTPAELLESEQYVARGFLAKMTHPDIGRLLIPQLPVQWNGRSFAPRPAPPLERAELAA